MLIRKTALGQRENHIGWHLIAIIAWSAFRDSFAQINESDLEHSRKEDLSYSWGWCSGLREFWIKAASDERYVLFAADQ